MADRPVVEIGDARGVMLGQLSNWDNLEMVHRACDMGSGKLDVKSPTGEDRRLLREGATIQVSYRGKVLQFGFLKEAGEDNGVSATNKPSWWDPMTLLDREYAFPNPSPVVGQESFQAGQGPNVFDLRTGYTTSVILGLVRDNIGPNAIAWRKRSGVMVGADEQGGAFLSSPVAARWSKLLELCKSIAIPNGVVFGFTTVGGAHYFEARQVADLSDRVVFAHALNNLGAGSWSISAPGATRVLVLGPYDGTDRMAFLVTTSDSLAQEAKWGRPFLDVLDSTTKVRDQRLDDLAKTAEKTAGDAQKAAEDSTKDRQSAEKDVAKAQENLDDARQSLSEKATTLATDSSPTEAQRTAVTNAQTKVNERNAELVQARADLVAAQAKEVTDVATAYSTFTAWGVAGTAADNEALHLTVAAITAEAERKLVEKSETVNAQYEILDGVWVFGEDYFLGDLVGIQPEGWDVPFVLPVREVTEKWSVSGGRKVTPVVGDYGATSSSGQALTIRQLQRTVDSLQSRR